MIFKVSAKIILNTNQTIEMPKVWDLYPDEFSKDGEYILKLLESQDDFTRSIWELTKWTCQAILEFQDLQNIQIPYRGKWFNINYLFFEGLSVLREAFLCGINGQTHASLTTLRSGLEIITTHYWWKERALFEKDNKQFYDWIRGELKSIPFAKIIDDTFCDSEIPTEMFSKDSFKSIYSQLCSYAHKPTKDEAITTIRESNIPKPSVAQCIYWLGLTYATIQSLLYLMIIKNPICLFPVPQYNKFGFNPPVGIFFDLYNYIPLCRAITQKRIDKLRLHYIEKDPPKSTLDWFYEQPDLDNEVILASWDDQKDPIKDDGKNFEEKMLLRIAVMKAKMRTTHYSFSYGDEGPEIPDLDQIIKSLTQEMI